MTSLLKCHPATPCAAITSLSVDVSQPAADRLHLRYTVRGEIGALFVPPRMVPARTDDLWKTTCFEVFIRDPEGAGYAEFNLSPSGQWAAYAFERYRTDSRSLEVAFVPEIEVEQREGVLVVEAIVPLLTPRHSRESGNPAAVWAFEAEKLDPRFRGDDGACRDVVLALSAVIEKTNGTKSYWALAHPPGAPDFHHADCFALTLPAFGAA